MLVETRATRLAGFLRQIKFGRFFDWLGRPGGSYVMSLNGEGEVAVG
jgi:hypothetical protein